MERSKESGERIAIALVGYGRFGRWHACRLKDHPRFALACIVDSCGEARQRAAAQGFEVVASIDEIPRHVRAASVVTPPATHAELAIALMRRGVHVLVEKPLATTEDEIRDLLRVSAETGQLLYTGHIERFNRLCSDAPWDDVPGRLAFRRRSRSEGTGRAAILDLMVHDLDLAAYLLRLPPDASIEVTRARLGASEVEVDVEVGPHRLHFHAGYGSPDSGAEIRWSRNSPDDGLAGVWLNPTPAPDEEDALTRQFTAFHDALRGQETVLADGVAGAVAARRALAILAAL